MPALVNQLATAFEQAVVLHVQGGQYAVPIGRVQEIVRVPTITRVPVAPADVEGVINLRGQVLPVSDLARRLGLGATVPDRQSRVVVVQRATDSVGLLVDGVSEVLHLSADELDPPTTLADQPGRQAVQAIARVAERLILLLDLDTLLNA